MSGKAAKVVITERQQVVLEELSNSRNGAVACDATGQTVLLAFEGYNTLSSLK